MSDPATLKPGLGAWQLWGIAVGLVISGEYFGWSYGWATAGTLGFLVTSLLVAVMYLCFIFSFTELTTAIPHAGGPYAYVSRAFGPWAGWMAGCATLIEFIFAPPAIALSIGAYLHVQFPWLPVRLTAIAAYLVFMGLNMLGVSIAASFELVVTLLAIAELLVFMGVVAPGFHWAHFSAGGWAGQAHFSLSGLGASWRPFLLRSGSSWPSRERPWQPKRPAIRIAISPGPIWAVSLPCWCWPLA